MQYIEFNQSLLLNFPLQHECSREFDYWVLLFSIWYYFVFSRESIRKINGMVAVPSERTAQWKLKIIKMKHKRVELNLWTN